MYLILENTGRNGKTYAYFEDNKQFGKNEKTRCVERLRVCPSVLDKECELAELGTEWYMVIPVRGNVPRRQKDFAKKKKARK